MWWVAIHGEDEDDGHDDGDYGGDDGNWEKIMMALVQQSGDLWQMTICDYFSTVWKC